MFKRLGAGIALVVLSLMAAHADVAVSGTENLRILNGPIWINSQDMAFAAAKLEDGARHSSKIGVYTHSAGTKGLPKQIASTARPQVCLSKDRSLLLFQGEALSGSIETALVQAYDLSSHTEVEIDQAKARAQMRACLGVREITKTQDGCRETQVPVRGQGTIVLRDGTGCQPDVSFVRADGSEGARLDFDWTFARKASSTLGAHAYRVVSAPKDAGAMLYPALSSGQRAEIWKEAGVLPVISLSPSGGLDLLTLPWDEIFTQRFYQIAPMAHGLAIAITTDPDAPDPAGGIWTFEQGKYQQVWQGYVEDHSLAVTPDGTGLGFVSLPEEHQKRDPLIHRIITLAL